MKMKKSENFNSAHCDIVYRPSVREGASDGERSYVEHVHAQKLSISERIVVLGALVLLGVAGMSAHFGASMPSVIDPIATASVSGTTPHHVSDRCREYSPYAERAC
jgi:hypothetical protein